MKSGGLTIENNFFILKIEKRNKNDKKNSAGAGSTKHAAERSERVAKAWRLIKGQVGPRHNYREKHRSPTKCLVFEIKENTENIAEYRQ